MEQTTVQSDTDRGAVEQTKQTVEQAADQAQQKAQDVAHQARSQLRDQVDQRSTDAGLKVSKTADDLRTVAQQLRERDNQAPAKLAEQAADRAERVGSYLTASTADQILDDAERFGRRRPWAVIAGGLAIGFAAARVLKASSSDRYSTSRTSGRQQLPRSTPSNGHSTNPIGSSAQGVSGQGAG
jgi:hypothetical protein